MVNNVLSDLNAALKIQKRLESVSAFLLPTIAVLSPWLLGGTKREFILNLTTLWITLGSLGVVNQLICIWWQIWTKQNTRMDACNWTIMLVGGGVVLFLAYVLKSVVNVEAKTQYTFMPGVMFATGVELEYLESIESLPHSYSQERTKSALLKYVAMALSFFAARAWFTSGSRSFGGSAPEECQFPTKCIEMFLWTLSVSSAALALVGILQRLDGTEKLLWMFANPINK